ncbi:MAG TPA: oligosaccharide flippase family protein [Longimicrobiaceae bacterium]|jgi:PST family polysaccharide transporter
MVDDARPVHGQLRRVVVRETLWNTIGAYSRLVVQLAVTAVLARLLSPEDFGIVASVLTFTAFFDALVDVGLVGAVLQRPDASQRELSGIFWLTLSAAGVMYLLLYGGVSLLGGVFGTAEFTGALRLLGLNILLVSLLVVPTAILRRRLELRALSIARLGAVAAGATVAIPMALAGYGYWALVGQSLATYGTQAASAFWLSRWRPRLALGPETLMPSVRFSLSTSLHTTINYWSRNAGNLLIARFVGAAPLGEYNLAQRVVSIPIQLLGSALGPTLHPTYAIIGGDLPRLRSAHSHFLQLTGILSFSVAAVLGLTADRLIPLLWGPQWTASVALVYPMLPVAAVQPVNALSGPLYLARDRTGLLVRITVLNGAAVLAGMAVGLRWGAWGVAWGYSLAYVCVAAPVATLTAQSRLLRGTAGELAAWLRLPLATCAVVLAAGWAGRLASASAPPLPALAVIVLASLLGFLGAVRGFAWPLVLAVLRARSGPRADGPGRSAP